MLQFYCQIYFRIFHWSYVFYPNAYSHNFYSSTRNQYDIANGKIISLILLFWRSGILRMVQLWFILSRTYNLNMRNIRKQLQLLSSLSQTVLHYRLEPFQGLLQHVKDVRKKIRHMMATQIYQEGISEMLISKEGFQIKNKLTKLGNENCEKELKEVYVQIRISAIEKCSCQTYNQQLWQFGIIVSENKSNKKNQGLAAAVVELMEFVLKHLQCSNLLPLNKQKNRYMLDHKVIIAEKESDLPIYKFENMSNQEVTLLRQQNSNLHKVTAKYFYNDRKIQQSLKQIIMNRSLEASGNSKKHSTDSTDTSRRVSLYQYYDDELDITVLSGSDLGEERGEEIYLELPHSYEEEEFQILMEETLNQDQLFLRDNLNFFKQLSSLQNNYF